jgi:hypothetical protein
MLNVQNRWYVHIKCQVPEGQINRKKRSLERNLSTPPLAPPASPGMDPGSVEFLFFESWQDKDDAFFPSDDE